MNQLKTIPNKEFLQELKTRITENKIDKEELFKLFELNALPRKGRKEIITEYEVADLDNLTPED
jgi:hypothetical protein